MCLIKFKLYPLCANQYGHAFTSDRVISQHTKPVVKRQKYRKSRKSTEKYRKYHSTGTGDLGWSRGVHRHPYCRVFLSSKRRKNEKNGFSKKPDFPVRIRIRWYGNLRGVTQRSQGVRRSEKSEKKFRTKSGFPGSGSGFPVLLPCRCDRSRKGYLQPKFQTSRCRSFEMDQFPYQTIL